MRRQIMQNTEKRAARTRRHGLRTTVLLAVAVALCVPYLLIRPALARELLCEIPEHTHTDSCYTQLPAETGEDGDGDPAELPLTCTITDETHVHGPRCYGTWVLTCGLEEHTHTEACYSAVDTLPDGDTDDTETPAGSEAGDTETPAGKETGGDAPTGDPTAPDTQAGGTLEVSLLYEDERSQAEHPDGVSYYTHSTMAGYIRLEPKNLDENPTNLTVTLSMPKQYVEENSIRIPPFSTDSTVTEYTIGPVEEDGDNYTISIVFSVYDRTQTLVLPFTLSFLDDVVPDNYRLPVTASVPGGNPTAPNIYRPLYKDWEIQKFVNSNRISAFGEDGAEVVVTPQEEGGNPYLDDLTYVDFAFIVNNYTNDQCGLADLRDACSVTLTDTLPTYTDKDGMERIAVFDADQNPGWTLSEDGKTVSKTYTGEHSAEILLQIYNDALHLRFPGLQFDELEDGTLMAELDNTVQLEAIPSGEAPGETRPTADDPLRFRLTTDPGTQGQFTKGAEKGDIYDVDVYKTNPYPWSLALSNDKAQPLRHIVIQDRTIVENGEVVLAGLDEDLRFVRLESVTTGASLPEGKTYADIVDHITAYYTDGTMQTISALQADAHGNLAVTFDEEKVCDGYEIVFTDDYEMQAGGKVRFRAYTVYRDPEHTHVPDGQTKVTYTNAARSINSYPLDGETKYVYLNAQHSYDMLPTTEHLSIGKRTLCNDGTTTLAGRGGNHIGDYFLYQIDLTGSLLEPEVKTYEDLRIVDLLPDGIRYDSIYLLQGVYGLPFLDGGNAYQPEILENYHNSGRTAVIFHLNAENLQRTLATVQSKTATLYFWVQIEQSARPGTVRNEVYVVGDNLDEYQGQTGGAADRYDLNNNGETDDKIAYAFSDATIIAAQSMYAEKCIAPAGSNNWSKQGLLVKAGSSFDYLLEIVNETADVHTGLTVYDTLPRIGDPNLFGASGRGSEFPVHLRSAITPPEGYTVYYTTSDAVYTHSMEEMVSADIWTATVSDYASVTAFKLVAGEGTVLAGNSTFRVRIPVCAPKTFDEDSMELLHTKADQDQDSGTVSWLQAVNAFGFRTVQAPAVKESNTVWARVCFAGFCVKKVNGATQAALPGAEFTLTDAAGTVVGTAVSDTDGRLQFRELTEGTYTLTETKVPDGFLDTHVSVTVSITQNPVTLEYSVTFSGDHTGLGTSEDPLCIENHGAYVLPKTGGRGIAAFYVPGAFLLLSAAALPDLRKRRSRER